VTVGSIGPLLAIGGSDNGFLKLDQVEIPRENMLAKYSEVQFGSTCISYGGVMNVRLIVRYPTIHCWKRLHCFSNILHDWRRGSVPTYEMRKLIGITTKALNKLTLYG